MGMCIYICVYLLHNLNRLTNMCLICEDILISVYIPPYLKEVRKIPIGTLWKSSFLYGQCRENLHKKSQIFNVFSLYQIYREFRATLLLVLSVLFLYLNRWHCTYGRWVKAKKKVKEVVLATSAFL